MCLQSELSTELCEAKNLIFNIVNRTLGNSNLNIFWQYFTTSISVVFSSFIGVILSSLIYRTANIGVARILSGVAFFPRKVDDLFCTSPSNDCLKVLTKSTTSTSKSKKCPKNRLFLCLGVHLVCLGCTYKFFM